jgi:hypothetical protein
MKRLMLLFAVALFVSLYPGIEMAMAQQGHGGGPGMSHGPSADSRGPMNSSSVNSSSGSQGAASSSPQEVLTRNTKLDSTLTTQLQSKNLLPAGTDLKTACTGFRNLGQCVAAIHVSHNLKIPFACMKADVTGQAPVTGTQCPTGTGSSKLSLGKSIQALAPGANSKQEATTGTKQADSDLKDAESAS